MLAVNGKYLAHSGRGASWSAGWSVGWLRACVWLGRLCHWRRPFGSHRFLAALNWRPLTWPPPCGRSAGAADAPRALTAARPHVAVRTGRAGPGQASPVQVNRSDHKSQIEREAFTTIPQLYSARLAERFPQASISLSLVGAPDAHLSPREPHGPAQRAVPRGDLLEFACACDEIIIMLCCWRLSRRSGRPGGGRES